MRDEYYDEAILCLQKARMWAGKILGQMGQEYPYPNSVNDENDTIDPAADIDENIQVRFFDENKEYSEIQFIKWARKVIDDMVNTNDFLIQQRKGIIDMPYYELEKNLIEAKMFFGMALSQYEGTEETGKEEYQPETEQQKADMKLVKEDEVKENSKEEEKKKPENAD
jgi:hypothetical protein